MENVDIMYNAIYDTIYYNYNILYYIYTIYVIPLLKQICYCYGRGHNILCSVPEERVEVQALAASAGWHPRGARRSSAGCFSMASRLWTPQSTYSGHGFGAVKL